MKTYLVTGGSGFIGSHLCEVLLGQGNNVINVDNLNNFYDLEIKKQNMLSASSNSRYKFENADIVCQESLQKIFNDNQVDVIVHLAAMAGVRPSIENPQLYYSVNITGTLNLLEEAKKHNIKKFVFASSSSVYGNNKKVPFEETDVVDYAISPYAASKKSGEVMCHAYHHLYDMDVACLRFFTVYGERQRPDLAIHKFTKMIEEGLSIPFFGEGNTMRDYTYVKDIIDGVTKTIGFVEKNNKVYEIFNLGESETITLKKMVETIESALGKKATINKLPMQAGDVDRTFADISKAKTVLGYNPQTNFSEGITNFVKWYKNKNA